MLLFVYILCPHSGFSEVKVIKIILFRVTNVQQKCTKNRFLTVKKIKEIKVHFYGAMLYFVGFYVLLLFDIVLCIQIENLTAITASEQTMAAYLQNSFFSAGYLMAASIVALKCLNLVPDLAAWMIPEGDTAFSTRNFGEGVAQQAKMTATGGLGGIMR